LIHRVKRRQGQKQYVCQTTRLPSLYLPSPMLRLVKTLCRVPQVCIWLRQKGGAKTHRYTSSGQGCGRSHGSCGWTDSMTCRLTKNSSGTATPSFRPRGHALYPLAGAPTETHRRHNTQFRHRAISTERHNLSATPRHQQRPGRLKRLITESSRFSAHQ